MKKFLSHTLLFLVPVLLLGSGLSYFRYHKLMKNIKKAISKYQVKSTYFIGDSHIEAIDAYLYDTSIANLGQGGEQLEVSIAKIKTMLAHTQNKIVYLGFAENNIVNNPSMREETSRRLFKYELYNAENKAVFMLTHPKDFIHFITFDNTQSHGFGDGRGTSNSKIFKPKEVKNPKFAVMHFHYSDTSINRPDLYSKITDLNDFIVSRQSKLILINTPATVLYKQNIPKSVYSTYNELLNRFSQKGIATINYETLDLNDTLFHDMNHLNVNGSKAILSIMFAPKQVPAIVDTIVVPEQAKMK